MAKVNFWLVDTESPHKDNLGEKQNINSRPPRLRRLPAEHQKEPAMETGNFFKNSQITVLGVCIAFATIVSSLIFSQGLMKIKRFSEEVINVTGSAEKKISSDYMVWKLDFSRRDLQMTAAYQKLQADFKGVREYLEAKGIKADEIVSSPVNTKVLYKRNEKGNETNDIEGYILSQTLEVRSYDVERVTGVSRQATELINQGIEVISNAPEYFYTKLP